VLKQLARWVGWRYEWNPDKTRKDGSGEKGDWDKPPRNVRTGKLASSTNRRTWDTCEAALAAYRGGGLDGVGLVLHREGGDEGPGLVGIDLDNCVDPETGRVAPWAREVVDAVNSYTELSPSGEGLRIFLRGKLPPAGRKKGDYENYETGRYVTVTGHHLDGTPATVEHRQAELESVHRRFWPAGKSPADGLGPTPSPAADADAEVVRLAGEARNGAKFRALWAGDTSGHGNNASGADQALCNLLAFWCGPDPQRIDRLFRQSGLMRAKWDERHHGDGRTYGQGTVARALEGRTEYFDWSRVGRRPSANGRAEKPHGGEAAGGDGGPPDGDAPGGGTGQEERPAEAVDDPHRLARLALRRDEHEDGLGLRYWREEYHRWGGSSYRTVLDKEIRAEVTAAVKADFDRLSALQMKVWRREAAGLPPGERPGPPLVRKVTTTLVNHTLQALTSLALLPGAVEQPAWLEGQGPFPPGEILACSNQLVHLPSYADGNPYAHPLTPRFFSPTALDYAFDPDAPEPAGWLTFLNEQLWKQDGGSVQALQEAFGYFLLPDTSQQKILMIVGPKRSGKGTIARVLSRVVGPANVCAPTLASLGGNFGLQPLLGKSLAIVSDARLSGRTDAAVVVERLLSISGEDAQTIDRKNLSHVTCKLPVRFVILTNELPRLNDPSGALVGRLILLRLTQSWYGKEDTKLTDRLVRELPGILLWAIAGWDRLRERGCFVQPKSGAEMVKDMEDLSSPVGAFVRECCEVGPGREALVRDLFGHWKQWCEEKGRKDPGSEQTFGRDLRAAVPGLDVRQPRQGETRVRVYEGIRLRDPDPPEGF
jgi:putative DNA primase/helicase